MANFGQGRHHLYFKQFLDEIMGCASYLVACRETGEAAVIDPSVDIAQYEAILRQRDFTLRYVLDTHVHADHISGARRLAASQGAELCLYQTASVTYPFRALHDGEDLPVGTLRLHVLHTPGHRPELMSILIVEPERTEEPAMVLTGDSLLVGDVGRPDFGGGDPARQFQSVRRLLNLPDWVGVFPGHYEGPCGKSMSGAPSTTIGYERRYNPLVGLDHDAFIRTLSSDIPARPLNMQAIEPTNRGQVDMSWAMLTAGEQVREIEPEEIARLEGATVLDVREPEEFNTGHIPGAVNLPQAEIANHLDDLPRDRALYTLCQAGGRSFHAAQFLKQVGFERVANIKGGIEAWTEAGKPIVVEDSAG